MTGLRSLALSLLALFCAACGEERAEAPSLPPRPHPPKAAIAPARAERAILIVVDSLRPDALADPRDTPAFARLAADGVSLRARSAAVWCKPAVASILTSLDPERHGATADSSRLPMGAWTLPEVLQCHGLATAGFLANGYISDRFGFDQGWDHYVNYIREARRPTADEVIGDALAWIEAHHDERFFVMLHLIDPHVPYDPPAPFAPPDEPRMPPPASTADLMYRLREGRRTATDDEQRWLRALYRGEVRFVDAQLGVLLARLDALGLASSTLLAVTADHGEALGEDGSYGHAEGNAAVLDVPLLFRGPARPPATDEIVSTRDLAPTLLEALGVEIPVRFEGQSFGPRRARAPDGPRLEHPPRDIVSDRPSCE